jgi:hypothetical protein
VTTPTVPFRSIDEIGDFYQILGFTVSYRQLAPTPYIVVRREDVELHLFGLPGFDPEQSYGSCIVPVPDIAAPCDESFAAAMRHAHGKVLISDIPRMTRPARRQNLSDPSPQFYPTAAFDATGARSRSTRPGGSHLAVREVGEFGAPPLHAASAAVPRLESLRM